MYSPIPQYFYPLLNLVLYSWNLRVVRFLPILHWNQILVVNLPATPRSCCICYKLENFMGEIFVVCIQTVNLENFYATNCNCIPPFKVIVHFLYTVEPLIKDPPRKGHCMLNLSIWGTVCVWSPKNYYSLWFLLIENLGEEDNLSIRDKTAISILCLEVWLYIQPRPWPIPSIYCILLKLWNAWSRVQWRDKRLAEYLQN